MNENVDISLQDILKFLGKRIGIILLCAAILGASVLFFTKSFVSPQYEASVSIYVNNASGQEGGRLTSSDLQVALRLVATYINIIQSDTVLDKVIAASNADITTKQLRNMISADSIGDTEMFRVSVRTTDPELSMKLANLIAEIAPGEISQFIEGSTTKIIDRAKLPQEPCAPNYTLNTVLGTLIGAMLAILGLLLHMLLDTRIKTEEDLAKICKIPVMGLIPDLSVDVKRPAKRGKGKR